MGRREHAGHVFAKVCAPNTKAARQTGSIPRVAGRRHTIVLADIPRVLRLVDRSFRFPSVLPSFLLAAPRRRDETTPSPCRGWRDIGRSTETSYGSRRRNEGRDCVPLYVVAQKPLRNVIAYYVRDRLYIRYYSRWDTSSFSVMGASICWRGYFEFQNCELWIVLKRGRKRQQRVFTSRALNGSLRNFGIILKLISVRYMCDVNPVKVEITFARGFAELIFDSDMRVRFRYSREPALSNVPWNIGTGNQILPHP